MEMIDNIVISIHVEYKKNITEIEKKHQDAETLAKEMNLKVNKLESNLSSLEARWKRDVEIRENTVTSLREIIRNICEDVRMGREPRNQSQIEVELSFPRLPSNIQV